MNGDEPKRIIEWLRNLDATLEVLKWIASRSDKATDYLEDLLAIDDVIREQMDYQMERDERINRILIEILNVIGELATTGRISEKTRCSTAELNREVVEDTISSLQRQRREFQKNLNILEEQAAPYGFNVPLEKQNEIDWHKEKISQLEQRIADLKK